MVSSPRPARAFQCMPRCPRPPHENVTFTFLACEIRSEKQTAMLFNIIKIPSPLIILHSRSVAAALSLSRCKLQEIIRSHTRGRVRPAGGGPRHAEGPFPPKSRTPTPTPPRYFVDVLVCVWPSPYVLRGHRTAALSIRRAKL